MKKEYQIVERFAGNSYLMQFEDGVCVKNIHQKQYLKGGDTRLRDLEKIGKELEAQGYTRIYTELEKMLKDCTLEEKIAICDSLSNVKKRKI